MELVLCNIAPTANAGTQAGVISARGPGPDLVNLVPFLNDALGVVGDKKKKIIKTV